MLAKMLHRNIYMVEASKGVAKANFSLFTAGERVCNEKKFTTVKERIFSPEEAAQWMTQLQNECNKDIATTGPPIVLIFRTNHYNWLRFSSEEKALPDEEDNENSRGLENTMDFNEDFPMEDTERAQLQANQEALLENEEKSGDEFKDNQVKSKGDKQQLQAENNEHDEIEQFGGTRKEELTVFSTAGVNALVPAHRQPLRELDMKDEAQVMQWCMQYEISEDRKHRKSLENQVPMVKAGYRKG
ncbi:hypothetical protein PF007_g27719 [Phytophthora fragariae]|uniref:Uncharacterized protein n=2 Tax=Phytophthora fragariae TaxID=53985 RepID=A0A6A3Q4A1_9STRA|nr:hypothetical protein PF007_g27719 [Phytophthora fragariae]